MHCQQCHMILQKIILLIWFGALKNMFLLYLLKIAVVCSIIFSWNPSHFFRVLWWICSKEHIWEHLFEIETFCNKVAQELRLSTLVMKVKCSDSHMYLFLNLPSDFMIHWLWQESSAAPRKKCHAFSHRAHCHLCDAWFTPLSSAVLPSLGLFCLSMKRRAGRFR